MRAELPERERAFGELLNAGRASVGLAPVDDVYNYGFTEHP